MLLTLNGSVPSCFLLTADEVSRGSVPNAGLSLALQHKEPLPNYWRGCYPLSPFAMRRSLRLRGDTRMRAFHTKLISGQQVRIVAVGGSVAWGAIHARPRVRTVPAHARYAQWLRTTYPNASVEYINEASPGTTSSFLFFAPTNILAVRCSSLTARPTRRLHAWLHSSATVICVTCAFRHRPTPHGLARRQQQNSKRSSPPRPTVPPK